MSSLNAGKTLAADPSYSIECARVDNPGKRVELRADYKLYPGVNFFWVSVQMKPGASLASKLRAGVESVSLDGAAAPCRRVSPEVSSTAWAIGVRHAGDDGVAAFRIPGLVTTDRGTLLGVYDVRYNSSVDLQEHIDVGLSRSTDGGKSWEPMRLPLSFGEYGGLPAAQNWRGRPLDTLRPPTPHRVDCRGLDSWHGQPAGLVEFATGHDMERTAQLVLTKSTDDGQTWSAPINITSQVKDASWRFLLQGPGRGIAMHDGTLVFPIQFIDSVGVPSAG